MEQTVELGDQVKDVISGFQGIATGRTEWLQGCERICIQPQKLTDDGKLIGSEWFDEPQVAVVKKGCINLKAPKDPGGPRLDPAPRAGDLR